MFDFLLLQLVHKQEITACINLIAVQSRLLQESTVQDLYSTTLELIDMCTVYNIVVLYHQLSQ